MEYKAKSISVDQSFMEQQAVRNFLKLRADESISQLRLRDLLEIAKVVLRDELASCGCSEQELIGVRLEYQISQDESQEPGEIYSVEWNQLPQLENATESEENISEEQLEVNLDENPPLSLEFMGKSNQLPQLENATESEENISEEQPEVNLDENPPLSLEFMGKLTERFNETIAASEGGRLTSTRLNFRSFNILGCEPDCFKDNSDDIKYQALLCNGKFSTWIYKPGTKVKIPCAQLDITPNF